MNDDPWICMRGVRAHSAIAADGVRTGSFVRHSRLVLSCVACLSCGLHCAYGCFASAVVRYVEIVWPVLVYPSLTAVFTFALWLVLFR